MNLGISNVSLLSFRPDSGISNNFFAFPSQVLPLARDLDLFIQAVPLRGWHGFEGSHEIELYEGPWNRTLDSRSSLSGSPKHGFLTRKLIKRMFQSPHAARCTLAHIDEQPGIRCIVHSLAELGSQQYKTGSKKPRPLLLEVNARINLSIQRLRERCENEGIGLVYDTQHFAEWAGKGENLAINLLAEHFKVIHLNFGNDTPFLVPHHLMQLSKVYAFNAKAHTLPHVIECMPRLPGLFCASKKMAFLSELCHQVRKGHANSWDHASLHELGKMTLAFF